MISSKQYTFADLLVGDYFDFAGDPRTTTFWDACEKISERKYRSLETGLEYRVGSKHTHVFHVQRRSDPGIVCRA